VYCAAQAAGMGGVVKPYRFTVMSCSVIMLGMMGWMSTQAAASSCHNKRTCFVSLLNGDFVSTT
jgi:hypothetical protein